jgi:flagellar hook-associated protein 3 FlgL
MDIRITPKMVLDRQTSYMRRQTEALARLQEQASTGLRVLKPSDDPTATAVLMRMRSEDDRMAANQGNTSTVRSRLDRANSELLDVNDMMTRVKQLALEAANDGTDASAFEAMASEADRLLDRLLSVANTTAEGQSLFGGTATRGAPFAVTATDAAGRPTTISYQGSDTRASVTVGRDQQIDMLYSGEEIFQQPGGDVFQAVIGLRDLLRNTGGLAEGAQRQALSQQVGTVEQAQAGVMQAVGDLSASLASLEGLDNRLTERRTQSKIDIGTLESADIAEVVVNLTAQETLLRNTLTLAARTYDQNLLDLLR